LVGVASFAFTLVALATLYTVPVATDPGSFVGVAHFGVPWLLVNSLFGGYTAYALSRRV
jgi:hypothetical protein